MVRFTHTQQITIEFTPAKLANDQLLGIQTWNTQVFGMHDHPPIIETNVGRLMDNIMKLQPSKHYTVIPADDIESPTAGTHCPQAIWEIDQICKACMNDHRHVDEDMASLHHLHSKQCVLKIDGNDASSPSPGTLQMMSSMM